MKHPIIQAAIIAAALLINSAPASAIEECQIDMPPQVQDKFDNIMQVAVYKSEWLAIDGLMPELITIRSDQPEGLMATMAARSTCNIVRDIVKWNPNCVFLISVEWLGSHHTDFQYCQPGR